ncbi:MAG: hypothetical protein HYV38_00170 [Candidatus Levybacteria bacterium]|nr:hypothetical protein [Candidatus Levybacteria bacterium]MBI4097407.1 hypothetical protein [Candidatus Levybacteria bacterium]
MIVYHYTKLNHWEGIQHGSDSSEGIPGIVPLRRIGRVYHPARETLATYTLPEPIARAWAENSEFPMAWTHLSTSLGKLLLEVELMPSDDVGVVDFAHIYAGLIYPNSRHETVWEAEEGYLNSRIALEEFLADPSQVSLPEILIFNRIPVDRIRISDSQPLIEDAIDADRDGFFTMRDKESARLHILEYAKQIPELQGWVGPCQEALFGGRGKEAI